MKKRAQHEKDSRLFDLAAIDIDQTIAGGIVKAHLRFYNTALDLQLSEDDLQASSQQYPKTFEVPHIIEYRAKSDEHERLFQAARAQIRASEQVNLDLEPIPGSREALDLLLSTYSHALQYFTVRPPEIEQMTRVWLARHQFVESESVIICTDHLDKLQKVLRAVSPDQKVVLIDDSAKDLLEAATLHAAENPTFTRSLKQLTIVGFGISEASVQQRLKSMGEAIGVQVRCIPQWEVSLLQTLFHANQAHNR